MRHTRLRYLSSLRNLHYLRRSISKTHFRGFLDIYQNFRHVKPRLIVLHMVDGTEHLTFVSFVSTYLSTPLGEARRMEEMKITFLIQRDDSIETHTLRAILVFIGYVMIMRRMCTIANSFRPIFFCISTRIGFESVEVPDSTRREAESIIQCFSR